jgi:hypothetical protein
VVDQSEKYKLYKKDDIQCEKQSGVDDACVNGRTSGPLGVYDVGNYRQSAVRDVIDGCGGHIRTGPEQAWDWVVNQASAAVDWVSVGLMQFVNTSVSAGR